MLAHRARFATTRRAGHHTPLGQPWRDGRFWPDAASLVLEYASACPSSSLLTSGQNRSVSVVQFGRKPLSPAAESQAVTRPRVSRTVFDKVEATSLAFSRSLVDRIQHMMPIRRLPEFTRRGARCAVMPSHHKRRATRPVGSGSRPSGPVSRLLGASRTLDDAQWRHGASPAGPLLPRNRDTGSYGYHMLDFIH
jgi:hypothetical protein